MKGNISDCEVLLADFCMELLDLNEDQQVFVARTFFIGTITNFIRVRAHKGLLTPISLSSSSQMIYTIEQWRTISEFLLHISWFAEELEACFDVRELQEGNVYVEEALQLIHQNLTGPILSVGWLAEQIGISTTHLSNLFKVQMGETISNFIANKKIEQISYELINTNKSLQEIRETYGFMCHSHFIQHFKKAKGMTPLQYRKEFLE